MKCVLAIDLGGTSLRAALMDGEGLPLASAVVPARWQGQAETDPSLWWSAMVQACGRLAEDHPSAFRSIEAVAVCGMTRTQVFFGHGGRVLRPAITWHSTQAKECAERSLAAVKDTGCPEAEHFNAFHPAARLLWLKECERSNFDAVTAVVDPKDFLVFKLTDAIVSDRVSQARLMGAAHKASGTSLFDVLGLDATVRPPLAGICEIVATVSPGMPPPFNQIAGRAVLCGSTDSWSGVAGLGAARAGYAYNISGTSEVFGVIADAEASAPGLVSVDWDHGLWQLGGPSQSGADAVSWLLGLLGNNDPDPNAIGTAVASLLDQPRNERPILFLPFLKGERTPYWDPDLRGAFFGVSRQHGPTDFLWAVFEGIAFLNKVVLERAESSMGQRVREVRFGGGAGHTLRWAQLKADILGRRVVTCEAREPGLLGAAIIAWTGIGKFGSFAEGQEKLVRVAHSFEPCAARFETYDRLRRLFEESHTAVASISHQMADFVVPSTAHEETKP